MKLRLYGNLVLDRFRCFAFVHYWCDRLAGNGYDQREKQPGYQKEK